MRLAALLFAIPVLPGPGVAGQETLLRRDRLEEPAQVSFSVQSPPVLVAITASMEDDSSLNLRIAGRDAGDLANHRAGGRARSLMLGLDPEQTRPSDNGRLFLELIPGSGAAPRDVEVRRVPAGLLRVQVRDPAGSRPVPSVVELSSGDGRDLASFGSLQNGGPAGRTWLLPRGEGVLILPAETPLVLTAYSHAFCAPDRRSATMKSGGESNLWFTAGRSRLPARTDFVACLDEFSALPPALADGIRRSYGIARLLPGRMQIERSEFALRPDVLERRILEDPSGPWIIQAGPDREGRLPGPYSMASFELASGRTLHTNGPLIEPRPFVRNLETGRVSSVIHVHPHGDPGVFTVHRGDGIISKERIEESRQIPLLLDATPGEHLLLKYTGDLRAGSPRGIHRARALLVAILP